MALDTQLYYSKLGYMYERLINGKVLLSANDIERGTSGMTIGWGFFGNMWNQPFFVTAVRPQRYTLNALKASDRFSVNFFADTYKDALSYFGTVSGYDENKFMSEKLHATDKSNGYAPVDEAALTLNCSIITSNQIEPYNLDHEYIDKFYKQDNGYHVMLYGRIDDILVR
ncbi:MAG TPA: flavin reductase [Thermotogota bacterium]|mgnify:CR=1 FL=1|nr:flavin reductase [Thermotogota bacterium]HPJ88039.1 flavin reductase [Thermotogota bacterium]HPR96224.1 flavin reductase [Thermotogota bacterium]